MKVGRFVSISFIFLENKLLNNNCNEGGLKVGRVILFLFFKKKMCNDVVSKGFKFSVSSRNFAPDLIDSLIAQQKRKIHTK